MDVVAVTLTITFLWQRLLLLCYLCRIIIIVIIKAKILLRFYYVPAIRLNQWDKEPEFKQGGLAPEPIFSSLLFYCLPHTPALKKVRLRLQINSLNPSEPLFVVQTGDNTYQPGGGKKLIEITYLKHLNW